MSEKQNALQKPVFAPVSQGNRFVDDIDLSDIFAEYFNEGGDDPLTTFSNSSICGDAITAGQRIQQQQVQQISSILTPFGSQQVVDQDKTLTNKSQLLPCNQGIKTPYHAGLLSKSSTPLVKAQEDQYPQQLQPAKKIKIDEEQHTRYRQFVPANATSQQTQTPVINPLHSTTKPQGTGINPLGITQRSQNQEINVLNKTERPQGLGINPLGVKDKSQVGVTGGLSGRLGISMVGGQLSIPQSNSVVASQESKMPNSTCSIPLPVGRGIQVGNIVPQLGIGALGNQARPIAGLNAKNVTMASTIPNQYSPWMTTGGAASGVMTEQAMAERRQRNREHAKRSRVRKKFMLESLQHEVRELQKENSNLRMIIQRKIPQSAQKIIDECCQKSPLFVDDGDEDQSDESKKKVQLAKSDFSLISSLTSGQQNFVLSDPRLLDNPIVYASEGFYQLTGYTRDEVLGRNCRFLQGPGTDQKAIDVIRTAVANGTDATTCILNYKKDGTPFWNQFFVAALRDSDNCIVNYVGVQCAVDSNVGATALEDKVNSVLPLQNRSESPPPE